MPHLQDLWSEVAKERKDVEFLAINFGDEKQVIESWGKEGGFTLRAVKQEGDLLSSAFGVKAYPTNYVIGPDGKVLYRGVGFNEAAIRRALASQAETK
jgi:hypothetical protein